jgi:hypothetical protein
MNWFPVLLVVHIVLAVSLLLPSVVLPFVLRRSAGEPGPVVKALMAVQGTGTVVISVGLAATGAGLLWILGPQLLAEPWLIAALGLYAANLAVAAFISRPNLRALVGLGRSSGSSEADDAAWRRRARQQRWIAYGMAGVIGVIGMLMSTKPDLW